MGEEEGQAGQGGRKTELIHEGSVLVIRGQRVKYHIAKEYRKECAVLIGKGEGGRIICIHIEQQRVA